MTDHEIALALKNEYLLLLAKQLGAREALEIKCKKIARDIFHSAGISWGSVFSLRYDSGTRYFKLSGFDMAFYEDHEIYVIGTQINVDGRLSKLGPSRIHCIWRGGIPEGLPDYVKPANIQIKPAKSTKGG